MSCNKLLTRRLSGIHAAWHFWYAVGFGGERGLRKLGLYGIHPLTQRYVLYLPDVLGVL
ncbi:DUF3265 domain-containing protein [Vibrio vulnificus]|nr:DUF3265 domain-containing protein [Vibrio vulnificus]MCD1409429.1 DUF3265 domain-containing protein [Vibrio vulnificus]MCD1418639.1 DUF3265 domain-containing protein [Vibrio vulnificus]MCD1422918.1 DUF3265 domain-containing protein [Vibrio vulnificus]MCD1437988.1 DUF3265 domain-containing protein [Vibrio vulnificus]MCD1442556.1 DUF3265 domain-containing protein [Vibrio vulnificus]